MTCIIGLVHEGKVIIGGDRAAVDGWKKNTSAHSKVFRVGQLLFGTCGSHRMAQIIEHEFKPTAQTENENDLHYLVVTIANELRTLLVSKAIIGKNEDNEDKFEGGCLVGYKGNLYRLSSNFQIDHFERPFDGIGSGSPFALGAMQVFTTHTYPPDLQVRMALEAAGVLCCDVEPPYDVEVL